MKSLDEHLRTEMTSYVKLVLGVCGGNVTMAAKKAGRRRQDFNKIMKRYGVRSGRPQARRGNWGSLSD